MSKLLKTAIRLADTAKRLEWLPILVVRLSVGYMFASSGWGKLHKVHELVEYFKSLGVPAASIQAPFVAGLEFVGGVALILGLGTRVFGLLLAGTMGVALVTAFLPDPKNHDPSNLFYLAEWLLLVLMIWIAFSGPGKASLDHVLRKKLAPGSPAAE